MKYSQNDGFSKQYLSTDINIVLRLVYCPFHPFRKKGSQERKDAVWSLRWADDMLFYLK